MFHMQGFYFYLWYIGNTKGFYNGKNDFYFKIILRRVLLLLFITAVEIEIRILSYWNKGGFSLI